jgi:hypothetical protein
MSLECSRNRLREIQDMARKLATSAEHSGTREPELVQIAVHFHPADGQHRRQTAADRIVCEDTGTRPVTGISIVSRT